MKYYGFYSAKQALVSNVCQWETVDGKIVSCSETRSINEPFGKWDDYVYFGELKRVIDNNTDVPVLADLTSSLKEIDAKKSSRPTIDLMDYVDCPEMLISDLSAEMKLGEDQSIAKTVAFGGYVILYSKGNIDASKLYQILNKIGFTSNQIAAEILKQANNSKHLN